MASLRHSIDTVNLFLEKIRSEAKYLIHLDIWYKNILVENHRLSGIIDFEMSCLAPIRFEYYGLLLTNYTQRELVFEIIKNSV